MADIVQSITYTTPNIRKIPMPHFSDKTLGFHTTAAYTEKAASIDYVAPDLNQCTEIVELMKSRSNQFVSVNNIQLINIPISFELSAAIDSPISWRVNYLYPYDDFEDYLNEVVDEFGSEVAPLQFTQDGIFSYTFSLSFDQLRFAIAGTLYGIKFNALRYSARISSYLPIEAPDILYFSLNRNLNIETIDESKSETVDGIPIYDYNIQGEVV